MTAAPATLLTWIESELHKKLATLPDDRARYDFLTQQYSVWNYRRHRFFQTDGGSEAHAPHPQFGFLTATDFLLIMGLIDRVKDGLVRKEVA